MSKKANPTLIGLFALIGVLFLLAGLLFFSSSSYLFTPTTKCIIYFDTTLSGLEEGAPVKFRGVTIGSVSEVMIRYNQATNDPAMPVIIELRQDLIRKRIVGSSAFHSLKDVDDVVRRGVRAKLETESFVTGVLYVELEAQENAPPAAYHQIIHKYEEIPSVPTEVQKLMMNLAKIDLTDLQRKLSAVLDRADNLLAGIDITAINGDLTNLLVSANHVVTTPDVTNVFSTLKSTLNLYAALGRNLNTNTLSELGRTLDQTRGGMQNLRDMLAADSSLRSQLNLLLDQLTDAAQSISALADYLHNHPNALITGRKPLSEKNQ